MIKFPSKINALKLLQSVDGKDLQGTPGFYWAMCQLLAGIIFALLHIADVLEEKK